MSLASISFRSACQRWTTRALLSLVKKKWVAVRQSTTSTFTPPPLPPPLNYYYNMKYFKRWTTTRKKENSKSNNATVIRRSRVEKKIGGENKTLATAKFHFSKEVTKRERVWRRRRRRSFIQRRRSICRHEMISEWTTEHGNLLVQLDTCLHWFF